MFGLKDQSLAAVKVDRELTTAVTLQGVGTSGHKICDTFGSHEIREPRPQLAGAIVAKLLLLFSGVAAQLLELLIREYYTHDTRRFARFHSPIW